MSGRDVLHRWAPPGQERRYGPAEHQVYELFGATGGHLEQPPALVVLLHGGFWRAEWDRAHLRPLAHALADRGYAVALPEYVRTGMPGGGWPGTLEDVAAGLAAVRSGASPDVPVVLVGHSAGGHLAVWLLHQEVAAGAAGAVSLAGVLDLGLAAQLELDGGAVQDLLGGGPGDVPDRFAATDPTRLGRTPYPVVVVHGGADAQVPPELSRRWWAAAGTPGRDELVELPGVDHFALVDPRASTFGVTTEALEGLVGTVS
ncbi:alpha/beta hydrolase family protein [Ornithinimicrobium kibberense]|uniref:Alpha/beta hydrolase family protein n=1 Tax=Ornithinimicrobium kibberense TaxID=282060 RepID=A0ABV5V183_9MICO|nr:alpha/beta hydrolase [Ornithinimicrobium kibberense]